MTHPEKPENLVSWQRESAHEIKKTQLTNHQQDKHSKSNIKSHFFPLKIKTSVSAVTEREFLTLEQQLTKLAARSLVVVLGLIVSNNPHQQII